MDCTGKELHVRIPESSEGRASSDGFVCRLEQMLEHVNNLLLIVVI